jgi:hypothetical protein
MPAKAAFFKYPDDEMFGAVQIEHLDGGSAPPFVRLASLTPSQRKHFSHESRLG